MRRRNLLWAWPALVAGRAVGAASGPAPLDAPNVVPISPTLVTAGQPTAAALAQLAAHGFGAVIYLAPPTSSDAVADEPAIVRRQGLVFHNIPIEFEHPTQAHYDAFAELLSTLRGRKVLVHCQINLRASSMVFLYRVLVDRVPPEQAYDAVFGVWSPKGPWRKLIVDRLQANGIHFKPY